MSVKQTKAHFKYSQVIIHVQSACEPHDLNIGFFVHLTMTRSAIFMQEYLKYNALDFVTRRLIGCQKFATVYLYILRFTVGNGLTSLITSHFTALCSLQCSSLR